MRENVIRDIGGALLFGVPLVYTMEVWWLGETSSTTTLAIMTVFAALAAGTIRFVVIGRLHWPGALLAGYRCMAVSLLLGYVLAIVIGLLTFSDSTAKTLGMIAVLGIPLSLGAALGCVVFANPSTRSSGGSDDDDEHASPPGRVMRDIAACALGATFVALPIAPTGEIPLIASMTDVWRAVAAVPVCLVVCYTIVYASGFHESRGGSATTRSVALWQTIVSAAVAIVIAAVTLAAFGVIDTGSTPPEVIGQIAALAIPAAIGSAAGRIAAA